ncbi:MAG TPA: sigma-70 family RNA polymerase sigma factor, partial [Bacteroidota bacterium]|nr:sigma-70 family RNA polymerase sigma factor [Bacteroidota bacterium]
VREHSQAQSIVAWNDTPADQLVNKELRSHLDHAIQRLPLDYRIVFILRDLENQTAEETAKILNLSVPAVKSRLRRARFFLHEELNDYMTH